MPIVAQSIQVVQLGEVIGAEIRGVDVSTLRTAPAAPTALEAIRSALSRFGVIVMRQQKLSSQDQVAFARQLGTPRVSFMSEFAVEGASELTVVSNIRRDGKPIGLVDAGALWHTDGSYLARPDLYTVLYALEIPRDEQGNALGDTLFLSTSAALAELPASTRQAIEGRKAVHSLAHHAEKKRAANFNVPPVRSGTPDVEHPVIRTHPVTGASCLYVTEGHTARISGMPEAESEALLNSLWEHLKQPRYIYRHHWQEGDLLVWDNVATQHLAITDYGTRPRRLHRSGIEGPVPV